MTVFAIWKIFVENSSTTYILTDTSSKTIIHLQFYEHFLSNFYVLAEEEGWKKVAAAPLAVKKVEPKKEVNPLFEKRPRNFGIGN